MVIYHIYHCHNLIHDHFHLKHYCDCSESQLKMSIWNNSYISLIIIILTKYSVYHR